MIDRYTVGTFGDGDVNVLVVRGRTSVYVIEPVRFLLGLTRSAMVDHHLDDLIRAGLAEHPDAVKLAAARHRFRADEHVRVAS